MLEYLIGHNRLYRQGGSVMRDKRRFSQEFRRRVVEEMLSGISGPAQLIRKYEISGGLIYHWKKRCEQGKLGNESTHPEYFKQRIKELECMVGKLTMDNEFLKKTLEHTIEATRKKESLLPLKTPAIMDVSKGGVK